MRRALPAVLLPVLLTACTTAGQGTTASPRSARPAAAASPAAAAAPAPATRLADVPPAGTVTRQPGPFDDRFALSGTRLAGGRLSTALTVTSDVSELLVLEAQADFYDGAGRLLGSVRAVRRDDHADGAQHTAGEAVPLVMAAPASYAGQVSSAVLSVPVLVNE